MGIRRDLQIGQQAENKVGEFYCKIGIASIKDCKEREQLSDYDLRSFWANEFKDSAGKDIGLLEFTTEVKWDLYAAKSGNIAIEMWNPKTNKPSGLTATKADIWCHITDGLYFVSVNVLKKYVENNKPKRLIASGGDSNATLYLYDISTIFEDIFVRLDNLEIKKAQENLYNILCS